MNVLLSAAAGLLAADAFCKRRKSTSRRVTRSRMATSSSDSSSSESSAPRPRSYHKSRRKYRNPQTTLSIRSGPSTSSASTTSRPSSSTSGSPTTDSDPEDSSTDSSESTIPPSRRLCHGRLPNNINHGRQLPDHNTRVTRYTSPEHPSSSDADSSSSSDLSSDTESLNSASASRTAPSSSTLAPPLPPRTTHHHHPLHTRLSTFLPTIRASNAALERERLAGTLHKRDIENLSPLHDEDATTSQNKEKTYIEMDLGLGVLEERMEAGEITPSGIKRARSRSSEMRRSGGGEGTSPLETLMGMPAGGKTEEARGRKRRKVGIKVVD